MNGGAGLRTGQVAELAGVNTQTLRYYQRRGLLAEPRPQPRRPPDLSARNGHPSAGHQGRPTAGVHPGRGRHGHHTRSGLHQRAVAKLAEIDTRLADLTVIRDTLAEVVAAGRDDLTNCTSPDCPLPFAEPASLSNAS
jgi:MerR family regulatory protein